MPITIRHKSTKLLSAIGAAVFFAIAGTTISAVPAQAQEYGHGGPGYWHSGPGYWQERAWREHEWRINHPYYVYDRYWERPAYAYPPPPAYYPTVPPFGFNVVIR